MRSRRRFLAQALAVTAVPYSFSGTAKAFTRSFEKPLDFAVASQRVAEGSHVAATVHPLASQAATWIMAKGGNAIDAAVATAVTLSVVDGHNSGIGGGCLMLLRRADGSIQAIDGREKAPAAATRDMYIRNGEADPKLSQDGALACGVPGLIEALHSAHSRFGKLPWADLFEPAIVAARDGHPMSRGVQRSIAGEREVLKRFPASMAALTKPDGSSYAIGENWKQPDLANTIEKIATQGANWFYQGEFADLTGKHLKEHGGILTAKDFADYNAVDRNPLRTTYRGYQVLGFPTPSSGGIHIQQMLQMLEHFPLKDLYQQDNGIPYYHVVAEAMKLAFADRAFYLGDSDFVDVPNFLTDRGYTDQLREKIDPTKSSFVKGHFPDTKPPADDMKKHTTHFTIADAEGNWVALTATVNTSWGNKMIVPGTGVALNNEMDDFSISAGVPNAFGLIGADANCVEPGKRPLSSMSPTIVLNQDGSPRMTCGAAGGPRIINATLQNVLRVLDLGATIGEALDSSRIHHQWQPDVLNCEPNLGGEFGKGFSSDQADSNAIIQGLKNLGHKVNILGSIATAQGIESIPSESDSKVLNGSQRLRGACDPRAQGRVSAF